MPDLGRQIVMRAFERAGKSYSDDKLKGALPRLARSSVDDVLAAVGRGEMFSGDVVKAIHPDFTEERHAGPAPHKSEAGWFGIRHAEGLQFKVPGGGATPESIPIRGLSGNLPVRFAPNGGAVPGDRIIGILTKGKGITIYPIQSPALTDFDDEPDRWLDVRWDIDSDRKELFPAQIQIHAIHEPGSLASIAAVIGENGGNIEDIRITARSQDFREVLVDLGVWDLKQLNAILSQLRAQRAVSKAERVNG